jgi:hypothetical protein
MNDTDQGHFAHVAEALTRLRTATIVATIAVAITGCGGGGTDNAASPITAAKKAVAEPVSPAADKPTARLVAPRHAPFQGKTYKQWVVSFWQWVNGIDNGPFYPNPLINCSRPISIGQSGSVWYWATPSPYFHALDVPDVPQVCDQSADVIPAGTSILLATLDTFSSTLLPPGAYTPTKASGERAIADRFADRIQDMFVTVDNVPVNDIESYRVATDRFTFTAAFRWVFGLPEQTYGTGTGAANGYYLMLRPLPPGPHTIHYGGRFHYLARDFGPGTPPPDYVVDVTLLVTIGP